MHQRKSKKLLFYFFLLIIISSINNIDYSSEVRILSPIKLKRDHISFEGEVETVKFRDSIFNVSGKAMVYLLSDSNSSK